METNVFDRTSLSDDTISAAQYNLIIGVVLCWGFLVNLFMVGSIPADAILRLPPWWFFIGYFASCLLGIYLFTHSEDWRLSFLGYNFVVVPFGLVINIVVARYDPKIVLDAIKITGEVTFVMMLLGWMYPAFFQRIIGAISIALLVTIIVELIDIFVFGRHHGIIDWVVVVIFCGYIGYDWGRANAIPKTTDNAIDSAAALYMDIINLFLRIVRILGRR